MFTEENKAGDIPAHDKHADGATYNGITDGVHITQVFGGEEQGIGSKRLHERTVHSTEQDEPEQQEYLVLPEMKE